jgi:hypothetical protein
VLQSYRATVTSVHCFFVLVNGITLWLASAIAVRRFDVGFFVDSFLGRISGRADRERRFGDPDYPTQAWKRFFHAPATKFGAPDGNAQEPAWIVHAPSGDPVFQCAPLRHDERVRQGREVQQLSDVNRA